MNVIKPEICGNELHLHFLADELLFNTTSFVLEFIEKIVQASKAERIVLNLNRVTKIDSSAAGMFISLKNDLSKSGKRLVLKDLTDSVRRVLHFLDMTDFLELDADADAA